MSTETTKRARWPGRLVVTLALVALGFVVWSRRPSHQPLDVGMDAPAFAARTLAGDTASLADYRGQVVLLNVWATWCRPCVKEMPALQALYDKLSGDGFSVVAVSVDNLALSFGDPLEAVRGFVKEHGITFPILLDPEYRIESTYQIAGLPMSYLLDREGTIRGKYLGPRGWDEPEFEAKIRKLLETEN